MSRIYGLHRFFERASVDSGVPPVFRRCSVARWADVLLASCLGESLFRAIDPAVDAADCLEHVVSRARLSTTSHPKGRRKHGLAGFTQVSAAALMIAVIIGAIVVSSSSGGGGSNNNSTSSSGGLSLSDSCATWNAASPDTSYAFANAYDVTTAQIRTAGSS